MKTNLLAMTFKEQLLLIKRIHALISRKATGSPEELARRLTISKASVHRYLNELKYMGAEIIYCKLRRSYYYDEPFDLNF